MSKKSERRPSTTEYLPVPLTDAEKLLHGDDLVGKMSVRANAEAENKAAQSKWREQDKHAEAEVTYLARMLKKGAEDREVDVYEVINWDDGTIDKFREDTGELLKTRPMTPEERQRTFATVALTS